MRKTEKRNDLGLFLKHKCWKEEKRNDTLLFSKQNSQSYNHN